MIGVISQSPEAEVVGEFFQLFKTPWEFFQNGASYEVVISSGECQEAIDASLILVFSSQRLPFDDAHGFFTAALDGIGGRDKEVVAPPDLCFPVYGNLSMIGVAGAGEVFHGLRAKKNLNPVAAKLSTQGTPTIRVGYDLFGEIHFLLKNGQPAEYAPVATIENHIEVLRRLILGANLELMEIPPVPWGYDSMVCLTHDVDFWQFRRHFLDRTFFGFVYRASVGALRNAVKGRMPIRTLLANWWAVFRLPFLFLNLARDFWGDFDAYLRVEEGLPSTFFLIPRKGDPGRLENGPAPGERAARYAVSEMTTALAPIREKGCEIGLHGIDAWIDAAQGRRELERVAHLSNQDKVGVRMHWLYFDEATPSRLAQAGFFYDSSLGYNDAVGFRNGTLQTFLVPGTNGVMELPLHIMDTALFYPDRMNLDQDEAWEQVERIAAQQDRFGGVLTVNWHFRSLAPERFWGDFYQKLLSAFKRRSPWFATAAQTVSWFNKRRAVDFEKIHLEEGAWHAGSGSATADGTPSLVLRIHRPDWAPRDPGCSSGQYEDHQLI